MHYRKCYHKGREAQHGGRDTRHNHHYRKRVGVMTEIDMAAIAVLAIAVGSVYAVRLWRLLDSLL